MSDREYLTEVISERDALRAAAQDAAGSTASRIGGAHDPAAEFTDQHDKNMHILGLIRDDHAWALSRILLAERLEIAVDHVIADSPGTPETVKGYLRKAKHGY